MDVLCLRSLARLLYRHRRGVAGLLGGRCAMRVMFIWPRTREFPVYERLVPTLTIPYLAALTPSHWEISFADDNHGEVDLDARPDLVAISVSTMSAVRAYELADVFRARGVPVVLGGWHVTLCPDDEEAASHADAVVVGEADDTWPALLADFERGRLKPRYVSQNGTDLAAYPLLDRVVVGFESSVPQSIGEMNKERTNAVARYKTQIQALQRHGIGVLGMFTFGFDHDPPDVFERTLAFCDEADMFAASFGILTPFPGTPTFQKLDAEGRIRSRDWRRYDLQHLVYELPGWSPERLESAVRDVEARFYGWRAFVRRTAKLRRYPRLLRPATLFLYLVVSLQYAATFP